MKIRYLDCDGKNKLFSFHRHDFNKWICPVSNNTYFIDGGDDYIRYSGGQLKEDEIDELIEYIRVQFKWGINYTKEGNKLEKTIFKPVYELSNLHIINIIQHLYEREILQSRSLFIMLAELKYRLKNNIIIND